MVVIKTDTGIILNRKFFTMHAIFVAPEIPECM